LGARVEKRYPFSCQRVECGATGTFPERAGHAGKGKVFDRCRAAIGERADVIDMESRLLSGLRKRTVFATSARALKNSAF